MMKSCGNCNNWKTHNVNIGVCKKDDPTCMPYRDIDDSCDDYDAMEED